MYVYFIYIEYLRYKVLIFCLCRLFGVNDILILTTFPYNSDSAIQGGCQLLLKLSITDLYAYCIFFESLRYKVLIFCLCGSLGGNSLLMLTTFSYNINSAIQGGFQLLLKLYITGLNVYCISVEYFCYKLLIFLLCMSFDGNSLFLIDINYLAV